jgi:hypothetical protein
MSPSARGQAVAYSKRIGAQPLYRRSIKCLATRTLHAKHFRCRKLVRGISGFAARPLYAAVERGEIPAIRIGRSLRVPIVALDRMLDRASVQPTSTAT